MGEGKKRVRRADYIKVAKTNKRGRPLNCRNCHLPKTHCICGRPTKLTAETLVKLQEAYSLGCDHEQAAFHAEVDVRTLRSWREENPPLARLIDHWRERPNMRAFNRSFAALLTDTAHARWWLERNLGKRFAPMQKSEVSGPGGKPIEHRDLAYEEAIKRIYGEDPAGSVPPASG